MWKPSTKRMETVETFESLKRKRTISISLFLLMQFPQFPYVLWTVSTTVSQLPCSFQLLGARGCRRRPPGCPRAPCGCHRGLLWIFQKSHAGVPEAPVSIPEGPVSSSWARHGSLWFRMGPHGVRMGSPCGPMDPYGNHLAP